MFARVAVYEIPPVGCIYSVHTAEQGIRTLLRSRLVLFVEALEDTSQRADPNKFALHALHILESCSAAL